MRQCQGDGEILQIRHVRSVQYSTVLLVLGIQSVALTR